MKLCADEHVSPVIVRIIKDVCLDPAHEFIHVEDIDCKATPDQTWVRVFAANGGQVVVSADEKMTRRHAELVAIADCGLKLIVLPHQFPNSKRHLQAAFMCHHWPSIETTLSDGHNSRFWKVRWGYSDESISPLTLDIQNARNKLEKANRPNRQVSAGGA